jgi:soluble lytic murein transglycosylase-like protein
MGFGPVKVFTGKNAAFSYVGRGNRSRPKTLGRLNREAYKDLIQEASEFFKVEAALIRAVIHAESAFDDRAQSPKGAMGLMQLMPDTAKSLGVRDAYDAKQNIFGGTKYLAYLLKLLQGDVRLALASYNAGPESVKRYGGIPPYNETREYVRKVVELSESYRTPP